MSNGLKEIRKDALINGLILGVILLVLDILALYILANSKSIAVILLSYLFGYLVIPLTAAIILIKRLREKVGGYWTFRQATSGIFITFLSAYLLSSALSFAFVKYVNPGIIVSAKDSFVGVMTGFLSKMNAEPDKVDQLIEDIEKQFEAIGHNNASAIISNLISSIIILFITALIFAALFKKEPPVILNHPES